MIRRQSVIGRFALWAVGLVLLGSVQSRAAEPTTPPDNSLTPAEYVSLGLPAIDKPWTANQYVQSVQVLTKLADTDATRLPRFRSPRSGDVFARIISTENLAPVSDPTIPPRERTLASQGIFSIVKIFQIYAKPNGSRFDDAEVLELGGFLLRYELAAVQSAEDLAASTPNPADPEKVKAGLATARGGILQTFSGVVQIVGARGEVRSAEAVRFCGELKTLVPKVLTTLSPEQQAQVRKLLQHAVSIEKNADVKAALRDVLKAAA